MKLHVRYGVLIGNVLNHYDTALFGWTAPFLAPLLFPGKSYTDALLLTFALLPLSYLMKPLGAFVWGCIGDRYGRRPVLVSTLAGTTLSTFLIGCLPLTPKAWILLAFCRIFQGFFSAGEKKTAALFLLEHTEANKRAWASAIYDATGILGIFIASLLATYWGETHWRELFWLSAATGLFAVFLRNHSEESPEFKPAQISWKTLWIERATLMKVTIVSGFSYANYFLLSVFLNGFLPQITDLSKKDVLMLNTHLLWVDFILLLGFGLACRWIQKETLMATGALLAAVCAIPLFMHLEGASWAQAALIRLSLVVFGVMLAAPYHAWKIDILPTQHRLLVGGVGSALGAQLFGSPMPLLSTWLVAQTGHIWTAALPIVILGLAAGPILLQKKVVQTNFLRGKA